MLLFHTTLNDESSNEMCIANGEAHRERINAVKGRVEEESGGACYS